MPLKRGIDQDLLTAHATEFEPQALKEALSFHTRSTRYINVVATGLARHDLQGNSAEPMAPEHIHHALMESYRRRLNRNPASKDTGTGRNMTRQDTPVQQRAKLIGRLANAIDASGMPRSEYAEKMRGKDETANTILNEAVAQSAERAAKDVALANAFNASGQSLEAFAQMYGMDARVVSASMERVARSAAPVTP